MKGTNDGKIIIIYLFSWGQTTASLALLEDICYTVRVGKANSCNAQILSVLSTESETLTEIETRQKIHAALS